jgi:hypothetical protein
MALAPVAITLGSVSSDCVQELARCEEHRVPHSAYPPSRRRYRPEVSSHCAGRRYNCATRPAIRGACTIVVARQRPGPIVRRVRTPRLGGPWRGVRLLMRMQIVTVRRSNLAPLLRGFFLSGTLLRHFHNVDVPGALIGLRVGERVLDAGHDLLESAVGNRGLVFRFSVTF